MLRSGDQPGAEQETWALLALYQLLRRAMTDATGARPGTDPDRASFTTALQTARDQLTAAAGIAPATPAPGAISQAVLAALLPPRRPRYSTRTIKSPRSRYPCRGNSSPALPVTITAITITITPPPPPGTRSRQPVKRRRPTRGSHRDHVTTLMATSPGRPWTARELASHLHHLNLPYPYLQTQLGAWARTGLLTRTAPATYTLRTPP